MSKKGRGKSKGSSFEREVCKKLSYWISGGNEDDLFWRSAMSGGRATVSAKKGKKLNRHAGDITATAPEGHVLTDYWFVECKFYTNLNLPLFLLFSAGPLAKFWRTAKREAKRFDKIPMLIAKQNRSPTILIVPRTALSNWLSSPELADARLIHVRSKKMNIDIYHFDEVLQCEFGD